MTEDLKVLYHDEVQLLDYGESRSSGPFVKLRLSRDNGDPLEIFRGLDVGTKIQPGHIFNLTLTQGDILPAPEEEEEPELKGGRLSKEAAIMIKHANFHRYLIALEEITPGNHAGQFEPMADVYLKRSVGINSKRELDHNKDASERYRAMCKRYSAWVGKNQNP